MDDTSVKRQAIIDRLAGQRHEASPVYKLQQELHERERKKLQEDCGEIGHIFAVPMFEIMGRRSCVICGLDEKSGKSLAERLEAARASFGEASREREATAPLISEITAPELPTREPQECSKQATHQRRMTLVEFYMRNTPLDTSPEAIAKWVDAVDAIVTG